MSAGVIHCPEWGAVHEWGAATDDGETESGDSDSGNDDSASSDSASLDGNEASEDEVSAHRSVFTPCSRNNLCNKSAGHVGSCKITRHSSSASQNV